MAIWTGSQKATAVKCLYELDLGLVGPALIDGEAELLHPKLVALWAREDVGLTAKDFVSYVAIVKDLDKLWDHLVRCAPFPSPCPASSLTLTYPGRRAPWQV